MIGRFQQFFIAASVLVAAGFSPCPAQDILPFPPAPSGSQAGVTIESSTYKKRVEPKHLPADAPNILIILIDGNIFFQSFKDVDL